MSQRKRFLIRRRNESSPLASHLKRISRQHPAWGPRKVAMEARKKLENH